MHILFSAFLHKCSDRQLFWVWQTKKIFDTKWNDGLISEGYNVESIKGILRVGVLPSAAIFYLYNQQQQIENILIPILWMYITIDLYYKIRIIVD